MNDLEKISQLLGWYNIKRKYISGIILTILGALTLSVGLIILFYLFPDTIVYHYSVIIYNGPIIRALIEIIIVSMGGILLLIGLSILIINTIKKNKL